MTTTTTAAEPPPNRDFLRWLDAYATDAGPHALLRGNRVRLAVSDDCEAVVLTAEQAVVLAKRLLALAKGAGR